MPQYTSYICHIIGFFPSERLEDSNKSMFCECTIVDLEHTIADLAYLCANKHVEANLIGKLKINCNLVVQQKLTGLLQLSSTYGWFSCWLKLHMLNGSLEYHLQNEK